MYSGKLIRFLDTRGFGFLALDNAVDSDRPTFVHISELIKIGIEFPEVGTSFEYDVAERTDGKQRAVNLKALS